MVTYRGGIQSIPLKLSFTDAVCNTKWGIFLLAAQSDDISGMVYQLGGGGS